ncbi:helix-turn-helix transcriptional regulator [Rhodococcoides yunnanense]|uniref:helix-turn-helix transcriptional regulator n=1 Tax=Rhodococcoides yunnanense TaxID=278209 RepID=UPI000934D767|nr:AraC family transcriptional regulator [Rhodococcus yunnanensis]
MLFPALRDVPDAAPSPVERPSSRHGDSSAPTDRVVPPPFHLTTHIVETDQVTRWPSHRHAEHELIWSDRGVINMIIDDRLWTVTPGVGLWIPRGVVHEGQANPRVAFRATLFTPELWTPTWIGPCIVTLTDAARVLLIHLAHTGMPAEQRLRAQQVCIDLLTPAAVPHFDVPIPRDPRLQMLVDCVLSDPGDDRSLDQWADALNLSRRTVTRIFANELTMSFVQWRTLIRMSTALGLLGTGMPVSSVSRRVGYRTPSSFIAAFRKTVGHTPGAAGTARMVGAS